MYTTIHAAEPTLTVTGALTVGVEEEFMLLDPDTGRNVPMAARVLDALPEQARAQSRVEFRHSMVEMVTPVCADLAQAGRALTGLRRAASGAAAGMGTWLVAVGATPVAEDERAVPDRPRYHTMAQRYGPIAADPAVCGCHVHVGVPERELAVQVCNHLRVWLPVIQALAVNSPFYEGADTGYASWRSVQLERWPLVGPTPYFENAEDYDRTVDALIASGVILDPAMVYWYARPSARYPTVEVRVCDVCSAVGDTVLVAGLVRALVATLIEQVRAGIRAVPVRDCLLVAAHWHAAHDGLGGTLVDLRQGRERPAWELVDELVSTVGPALLRSGDLTLVRAGLRRLRRQGTGAARQRAVHGRTGDLRAVLADLTKRTAGG
ncbi:carboxylate-amine ligase [Actinoplanes teichomyceticus]|uniref:Putative glutamate--cysteine ligase 2 n=1 Tax=Actinoplanes teichomyceticus TaxID=1867 RepID=A0A561WBE9_ACTTI|nr:glutamate--cysteine ligase [Actinoplanes teichomyceticus]TWG21179.1 carboxylate-amine ligase [Actinoplanes teichomyceticus]GIF15000.1 putative glutamate--cysteine ligase 2 [Actinoplanes teichomyceticus]